MNSVNCWVIYKAPAAPGTRCWCGGEKEKPKLCPKMTEIQTKHEQLLLCAAPGLQGAATRGKRIWKTTARGQTGDASSLTSRGPCWGIPATLLEIPGAQCTWIYWGKTKPQLNYKTSFALLAQIEIELKSSSEANRVVYLENLVTPHWDVKMITSVVTAGIPGAQGSNQSALGLREQQKSQKTLATSPHWDCFCT